MPPLDPGLRLSERERPGRLCAYCRDDLEISDAFVCTGCQIALHQACLSELERCPTPGCGRSLPRTRARQAALPARGPGDRYVRVRDRDPLRVEAAGRGELAPAWALIPLALSVLLGVWIASTLPGDGGLGATLTGALAGLAGGGLLCAGWLAGGLARGRRRRRRSVAALVAATAAIGVAGTVAAVVESAVPLALGAVSAFAVWVAIAQGTRQDDRPSAH